MSNLSLNFMLPGFRTLLTTNMHDQVLELATPAEIKEFRKALETAKLEYGTVMKALQETYERLTVNGKQTKGQVGEQELSTLEK